MKIISNYLGRRGEKEGKQAMQETGKEKKGENKEASVTPLGRDSSGVRRKAGG